MGLEEVLAVWWSWQEPGWLLGWVFAAGLAFVGDGADDDGAPGKAAGSDVGIRGRPCGVLHRIRHTLVGCTRVGCPLVSDRSGRRP